MSARKHRILGQIVGWTWLALLAIGCGGATVGPPLVGDGRHQMVKQLDVSLDVPVGFDRKKPTVWTLDAGGSRHAMLWIERRELPEGGVDGFVDKLAKAVGVRGRAGVTRRQKVMIGDLEAHYLEAATVVGNQAQTAMQLVTGAEDGLYMVSLVATAGAMQRNKKAFEACVKSFRVPRR